MAYGSIEAGGCPPLEAIGVTKNLYWRGQNRGAERTEINTVAYYYKRRRGSIEGRGMGRRCPIPSLKRF